MNTEYSISNETRLRNLEKEKKKGMSNEFRQHREWTITLPFSHLRIFKVVENAVSDK